MTYRVAVIQNESESLRYGYANTVQHLESLERLSGYSFERFDAQSLDSLFREGVPLAFDSIVIATNATSDARILSRLRQESALIGDFLSSGRGLFLSYQKKLVVGPEMPPTSTGFLPEGLEAFSIARPESDASTGDLSSVTGRTGVGTNAAALLLTHPHEIDVSRVVDRCRSNEFKAHLYRAVLRFDVEGAFDDVLVDTSFGTSRTIVAVNRPSVARERLVVSMVAMDWESHDELLENVLTYVTEGPPTVAFVESPAGTSEDFRYLVSSAALSKIPHQVYAGLDALGTSMLRVHGVFVLGPGWTDQDARNLWSAIEGADGSQGGGHRYRRILRLSDSANIQSLTQYSSARSTDLSVDTAITWLDSQFDGRMWGGGFWNSYDVLMMMIDLGVDVSSYLPGIFRDLRVHLQGGSYDGVVGATCGLLELMVSLADAGFLAFTGLTVSELDELAAWIAVQAPKQPSISRVNALCVLLKYGDWRSGESPSNPVSAEISALQAGCTEWLVAPKLLGALSELELCQLLKFSLRVGSTPQSQEVLGALLALQGRDGSWTSLARTANVLVTLLKVYPNLLSCGLATDELNSALFASVLFVRGQFSVAAGHWEDLQSTAKSAHALGLHNAEFQYSSQEFFSSILTHVAEYDRSEAVGVLREEMARVRLRAEADHAQTIAARREADAAIAESDATRAENRRFVRRNFQWRVAAVIAISLLLGLTATLLLNYMDTVLKMLGDVGALLPLVVGAVLAVPITLATNPPKAEASDDPRKEAK